MDKSFLLRFKCISSEFSSLATKRPLGTKILPLCGPTGEFQEYIHRHAGDMPTYLDDLASFTKVNHSAAIFVSSFNQEQYNDAHKMICPSQGRFLSLLSRLIRPRRVLELGTFTGYSALCLAEGVQDRGHIVTCDKDSKAHLIAKQFFERALFLKKKDIYVELASRPALDLLAELEEPFDLIFVDASKRQYRDYFELILNRRLLSAHGLLIFDNTLFRGAMFRNDALPGERRIAEEMDRFVTAISLDARISHILLPQYDGMSLITYNNQPSQ